MLHGLRPGITRILASTTPSGRLGVKGSQVQILSARREPLIFKGKRVSELRFRGPFRGGAPLAGSIMCLHRCTGDKTAAVLCLTRTRPRRTYPVRVRPARRMVRVAARSSRAGPGEATPRREVSGFPPIFEVGQRHNEWTTVQNDAANYPGACVDGFELGMFVSYGDCGEAWVAGADGQIAGLVWETGDDRRLCALPSPPAAASDLGGSSWTTVGQGLAVVGCGRKVTASNDRSFVTSRLGAALRGAQTAGAGTHMARRAPWSGGQGSSPQRSCAPTRRIRSARTGGCSRLSAPQ